MIGLLALNVSFMAAILLLALWLVARNEADLDWSKLMMVTAGIVALSIVPPMFLWPSVMEHFHLEFFRVWPVILIGTLVWQISVFVMMLKSFVWVPVPKALLVWLIVQAVMMSKDLAIAAIKGESVGGAAWTSFTGLPLPGGMETPPPVDTETALLVKDLQQLAGGGIPPAETVGAMSTQVPVQAVMSEVPVGSNQQVKGAEPTAAVKVETPLFLPDEPEAQGVRTGVVVSVPSLGVDREQEAARALLRFGGKAMRGGRTVAFVNERMIEVGETIGVNYKGKRYLWTLMSLNDDGPHWVLRAPPLVVPVKSK